MEFLTTWLVTAIATAAAIALVPGIHAVGGSALGPVMFALALALLNAIVKPILTTLALPATIVTLGFFYLVINAFMLELASGLALDLFGSGVSIDSFGAAFVGAIIISLASMIVGPIIGG